MHESTVASRITLQQFYKDKQTSIIRQTQEEVKKLNERRVDFAQRTPQLEQNKKEELAKLKATLSQSSTPQLRSPYQPKKSDVHPLVRRIDGVMERYTKFM